MTEHDGPYYEPPENTKEVTVSIDVGWSNRDIVSQAADSILIAIRSDIEKQIRNEVRDKLDALVNDALLAVLEKPVQPTNSWGEPIGEASSVRELLMRDTEAWLTERVDNYGKSSKDSYPKKKTRAQYLFKEATKGDLEPRVKKIVAENIADIDALIEQSVKKQLRSKLK